MRTEGAGVGRRQAGRHPTTSPGERKNEPRNARHTSYDTCQPRTSNALGRNANAGPSMLAGKKGRAARRVAAKEPRRQRTAYNQTRRTNHRPCINRRTRTRKQLWNIAHSQRTSFLSTRSRQRSASPRRGVLGNGETARRARAWRKSVRHSASRSRAASPQEMV